MWGKRFTVVKNVCIYSSKKSLDLLTMWGDEVGEQPIQERLPTFIWSYEDPSSFSCLQRSNVSRFSFRYLSSCKDLGRTP